MSSATVAAAGGVVWRLAEGGIEIALVHRPRYDDWTLPKGKLNPDETELECAVREVREELGANVAVQRRIGRVRYAVEAASKSVTYWSMRYRDGSFAPNDEVDQVLWVRAGRARRQLSYDIDRAVLADFAATPVPDSVVVLVRHAKAGRRSEWREADALRPLDGGGLHQAAALATLLAVFAPDRVITAQPTRCVQTVLPLATELGQELEIVSAFDDESYTRSPSAAQTALFSLAKPGAVSVVCSQGITIPSLLDAITHGATHSDTRKGDYWVLSFVDGDVVAADHYDAPPR